MVRVMKLFHGTGTRLTDGVLITACNQCTYYPDAVKVLEKGRPTGRPSRSICLFATDTIAGATRFMFGQKVDPFWIYEVEMVEFQRAPFRITDEIDQRLSAGTPVDKLVAEYWSPTDTWFFNEYFGPSFIVIREVPAAEIVELASFDLSYSRDLRMSKAI